MNPQTKEEEKIVLDTDPEAATLMKLEGWVSRDGYFYGKDEQGARWRGCTHKKCDCGNLMGKHWTKCESCIAKGQREKYFKLPFKEWDGETPVYCDSCDQYFFDASEIEYYLEDNVLLASDLRLLICKPNYLREVDIDYWADGLPENRCLPNSVDKALNALNKAIREFKKPISWFPTNIRTEYVPEQNEESAK